MDAIFMYITIDFDAYIHEYKPYIHDYNFVYIKVHLRCDLTHKWIIPNRDAAERVQCICAAGFCHLAREVTKETAKSRVCHPLDFSFELFFTD